MGRKEQYLAYSFLFEGDARRIAEAIKNNFEYTRVQCHENYFCVEDEIYPQAFYQLSDPPQVIYYRGNIDLLKSRMICIVGSRKAIEYSQNLTQDLVERIGTSQTIVSGLALGIDSIAHTQALISGSTIAILGCGIDVVYPKVHRNLYDEIENQGLILSEYPPQTKPDRFRFPLRNRLIAALGERVVVMQAGLKSGTMITVNRALELGKEVYVLPYRYGEIEGEGCNALIQQGANPIIDLDELAQ